MKKFFGVLVLAGVLLSGCSDPVIEDDVVGTLAPMSGDSEGVLVVEKEPIKTGLAIIEDPGSAVFNEPSGVTMGRIPPGEYRVVASEGEFFQIILLQEEDGSFRLAWVPASSVRFAPF